MAALEEAADVLPNLHLFDLDDTADYPERHAEAFGLAAPLPPEVFNHTAEVELLAPPGGPPLPRRLGRFGMPGLAPGSGAVDNRRPSSPQQPGSPTGGPPPVGLGSSVPCSRRGGGWSQPPGSRRRGCARSPLG